MCAVDSDGIDIIVVNYHTPTDLHQFLCSLEAFPPSRPWNLWICNVAPERDDYNVGVEWANKLNADRLTYHENVGYARPCNQAALYGTREVIAFFNADVVLTENALDECCDALLSDPIWGVLGPRQVNESGLLNHVGIFGTNQQPHFREGWRQPDVGNFVDVNDEAISVAGSAYFIRRTAWDQLTSHPVYREWLQENDAPLPWGAFLPTPLYYEDMFASVFARSQGWKVVYLGTTTIVHKWHKSVATLGGEPTDKYDIAREMYRSACDALLIERE